LNTVLEYELRVVTLGWNYNAKCYYVF